MEQVGLVEACQALGQRGADYVAAGLGLALLGFVLHVVFQQGAGREGIAIKEGRAGINGHALPGCRCAAHAAENVGHFQQFFRKSQVAAGGG